MKKILLFLFLVGYASLPAAAQNNFWKKLGRMYERYSAKNTAVNAKTSPERISRLLGKNVEISFRNSMQLQAARTEQFQHYSYAYGNSMAGLKMRERLPKQYVGQLYPGMERLLTSDQQFSDYFVTRNNREVLKVEKQIQAKLAQVNASIEILKKHQLHFPPVSLNNFSWLTRKIPADTSSLLIGETHFQPDLQRVIARFLTSLRQRFPEREIILLTEFFPEGTVFKPGEVIPQDEDTFYNSVWRAASLAQVSIVGMEPDIVNNLEANLFINSFIQRDMWCSLEGMRQRHLHWSKTIQQTRREHPEALFVIYAGNAHLRYNEPLSLTTHFLTKEKTFMLSFVPGFHFNNIPETELKLLQYEPWYEAQKQHFMQPKNFMPNSRFDFASKGMFPEQVLQFAPEDNALTGFDVQIKVPITKREN